MSFRLTIYTILICAFPLVGIAKETQQTGKYVSAKILQRDPPRYPDVSAQRADEGWVDLVFTVAKDATIKNIEVSEHSGVEEFVKPAVRSVSKYRYEPATLNGKPVESLHQIRVVFMISSSPRGASTRFVKYFKRFQKSLANKKADKAFENLSTLRSLKANNLYEGAFLNLAEYYYGHVVGDDGLDQIVRLEAATAAPDGKPYIPKPSWISAMQTLFALQVKNADYGAALRTYQSIPKKKDYADLRAELQEPVRQIRQLRTNDKPFATKIILSQAGFGGVSLLKPVFTVSELKGEIERFRMVCDSGITELEFIQDAEFQVPKSFGRCHIRVKGSSGSEFSLVQLPVMVTQDDTNVSD